jgi:hypothetical protein
MIEFAIMASDIDKLFQKFAADLRVLMRAELSKELGGRAAIDADGRAPRRAKKPTKARITSGGRRSPEQIERQAQRLLAQTSKNPDQRAEQLAKAVGLSTKELVGPVKKLLGARKIKASGVARGTTYKAVG